MRSFHRKKGHGTHILAIMEWDAMRLFCKIKWQWHSLSVFHDKRWRFVWQKKGQLYSHPVSHGIQCDMTTWLKNDSLTYKLLIMNALTLAEPQRGIATHKLLVNGWAKMRLHGRKNWQCCSHPVGWYKMRMAHRKRSVLLTFCWSCQWDVMWCDYKRKGSVTHSLLVMDEMWWICITGEGVVLLTPYLRWDGWWSSRRNGSTTHILLIMRDDELAWQRWQCHSQTVGHWRRCHCKTKDRTKGSVTHILLIIG